MKHKRAIKTISLVLAIILGVCFLQEFVVIPWQPRDVQITGFYREEPDSLDAVFIGASDMYTAFSPLEAYEEYGFTSYPFAPPRNSDGMWKIQVDEIMRLQDPKVIVIEVNGALYTEEDELVTEENLRLFTDHIPLSRQKKELIDTYVQPKEKINYYIPYLKYHGNITSLTEAVDTLKERLGFEMRGGLCMKGERTHFETFKREDDQWDTKDDAEELPIEPNHEAALRAFLEYAYENVDCPILFIRAPHYITEENLVTLEFFHRTNRVENVVRDYGFEFINFDKLHEELGLDPDRDFHNPEHLNYRGQQKFTRYLGRYLADNYSLGNTEHPEKVRRSWERGIPYLREYLRQGEGLEMKDTSSEEYEFYEAESGALLKRLEEGMKGN